MWAALQGLEGSVEECWFRVSEGKMALHWQSVAAVRWLLLMLLWQWTLLGHLGWDLVLATAPDQKLSAASGVGRSSGRLDWLLSDKGPFHRCPEYTEFKERYQQGFSTRYKIYR
ncbi:BMP/retinoic acid-inducible neural-specific protein 2 [Arapaima gigas]